MITLNFDKGSSNPKSEYYEATKQRGITMLGASIGGVPLSATDSVTLPKAVEAFLIERGLAKRTESGADNGFAVSAAKPKSVVLARRVEE